MNLQYKMHPTWISCLLSAVQHVQVLDLHQSTPDFLLGGGVEGDRHLECNYAGRIEEYATLLQQDQYSDNPDNGESHLQHHLVR